MNSQQPERDVEERTSFLDHSEPDMREEYVPPHSLEDVFGNSSSGPGIDESRYAAPVSSSASLSSSSVEHRDIRRLESDMSSVSVLGSSHADTSSSGRVQNDGIPDGYFVLKRVRFHQNDRTVVLQNENGPCPLLAIANGLLLAGRLSIHPDYSMIASHELVSMLGDYLMKWTSENVSSHASPQQIEDVIGSFPSLLVGLNVNIRFRNPTDFEYTKEMDVFDLFGINLYHGWVMDPTDTALVRVVGGKSYNQLMELLIDANAIRYASDSDPLVLSLSEDQRNRMVHEGILIQDYLDASSSQLTMWGLSSLKDTVQENEMCVFFRNNHFSTMYKFQGKLFLLASDLGFSDVGNLVWELFDDIGGNTVYCGGDFLPINSHSSSGQPPALNSAAPYDAYRSHHEAPVGLMNQSYDPSVVAALQAQGIDPFAEMNIGNPVVGNQEISDFNLAYQLQLKEQERARRRQRQLQDEAIAEQKDPVVAIMNKYERLRRQREAELGRPLTNDETYIINMQRDKEVIKYEQQKKKSCIIL